MIEGIQTLLNPVNMTPEEEKEKAVIKISEATQKHFELQIRTARCTKRPHQIRRTLESITKRV
jgi:hypothetical protein